MGSQGNIDRLGNTITSNAPNGGRFDLSPNNPIVSATTSYFLYSSNVQYILSMKFGFHDGTYTNEMGGKIGNEPNPDPHRTTKTESYPDHLISRIHINGVATYDGVDCVVYGFKYLNGGPSVSSRALGILYVTSPQELSGADIAQAFPTYGIADALITDELKAARQAYWAYIKARAEAPK